MERESSWRRKQMIVKTLATLLLTLGATALSVQAAEPLPLVELRPVPQVNLPAGLDGSGRLVNIDSNSPAEWDGDGNLFIFTSSQRPYRSSGVNPFNLAPIALPVVIEPRAGVSGPQWIEATYRHEDGTL